MGEPFKLDLHEKFHGPHGLVAGMTGSGKSEFIMTFILSLAVNYHPDEVAFILIELKTQQPEFMEQLISAARIGRSLGVHLILATQKPAGVVDDQIWSNSKFRVCLKVQEKADSMDMIKRPDAAEIAETGRFYLQVGFNELFEMGQSAWAGAPYYPSDRPESDKDESISVIDNIGRIISSAKIDRKASLAKNPPKQIDEIVKYIAKISEEENIKVRQLWLDPIAPLIYIDDIKITNFTRRKYCSLWFSREW